MSAIIPCLFGTTKGFEMLELAHLNFKVKDLLVAITHTEVELGLEDSCVKILRIKSENRVHTWIGLYRKAYEMGFSREGGYYGAGVWLSDATVNARPIIDALEDLCQQIRRLALQDRKFQRTLAEIEPQLVASPALNALLKGTPAPVRGGISSDAKTCAFITQPQAVQDIINWAQTDAMAHNFQSIIIAPASAFPKAGASGSITQYSDLPAVERALERDYTARVAKLDALARDWQRKAQSLEAEASARNAELQALKQKNSQLASETSRARLLVKPDSRGHVVDEDESDLPLKVFAVATVLLCLALGWFWFDEWKDARSAASLASDEIAKLKADLQNTGNLLNDALNKNAQLEQKVNRAMAELDNARSNSSPASNKPGSSGNEGASNSKNGELLEKLNGTGNSPPQAAAPDRVCNMHGCSSPPAQIGTRDQAEISEKFKNAETAPLQPKAPIELTNSEKKIVAPILKEIQRNSPEVGSKFVSNKIKGNESEITRILSWLEAQTLIGKALENDEVKWIVTPAGEDYLNQKLKKLN